MKERNYTYLNVDSLIKSVFYSDEREFVFSINSRDGLDEDLENDFGINEANSLTRVNQWDDDEEIDNFKRVFIFDKKIFVCTIKIIFDGSNLEASVSSPEIFDNLIDFYKSSFGKGIAFNSFQVEQIFGQKYNPVLLMKKAFSKYGYEYELTDEFDDWGLMYNKFKQDDKFYYLIGPQIEVKYLLGTDVYFNLFNYDRLMEAYGKSMIEVPELYLSFGELFSIIRDKEKLEKYLISEEDFKNFYLNEDESD